MTESLPIQQGSVHVRSLTPPLVLLAPTGAGKSFYAREGRLIDADSLPAVRSVYRRLSDIGGPQWWNDPDTLKYRDRLLYSAFETEIDKHVSAAKSRGTSLPPLATAEIRVIADLVAMGRLPTDAVVFWAPSPERYALNHKQRADLDVKNHPVYNPQEAAAALAGFRSTAENLGFREVYSPYAV